MTFHSARLGPAGYHNKLSMLILYVVVMQYSMKGFPCTLDTEQFSGSAIWVDLCSQRRAAQADLLDGFNSSIHSEHWSTC